MKSLRKILSVIIALFLSALVTVTAYAQDIAPFSSSGKIISVAHGGDTMKYPKNSLAAVEEAFKEGADCVSIDIRRTVDGQFVLSDSNDLGEVSLEGEGMVISMLPLSQVMTLRLTDKKSGLSDQYITDLSSALKIAVAYDRTVIINGEWEYREHIYNCICENKADKNAIIRTDAPKSEVKSFVSATSSMCRVVGEYHGNILFNARSYITSLSKAGCSMVFLGTKNPFGVIFRNGVMSAFSETGYSARAAMKTYDTEECGNRPDSEITWNDIIDRGYSVIETDRISDLVSYIKSLENERASLSKLVSDTDTVQLEFLTLQSRKDIKKARDNAALTLKSLSSFESLSNAKSNLNLALNNKVLSNSAEKQTKGIFRISTGRIAAVLIIGAALLFIQIYAYYMQADKKMPHWLKNLLRK